MYSETSVPLPDVSSRTLPVAPYQYSGRVAQPSDGKPHRGCPILRGFLRRVGGRLTAPWAWPFTPRVPETKSSPNPHPPPPPQTRRQDTNPNPSTANPQPP